jgi:hypothetical protein
MNPVERKEVDIVSVDPLFIERQRNRYASRVIAYVVWLNGLAAIALLISLAAHAGLPADAAKRFADGMLVFGVGSVAGLASAFVAYVGRTLRLEHPGLFAWRRPMRWVAIIAAVIGAICFLTGVNMVRRASVLSARIPQTESPAGNPATAPSPSADTPPASLAAFPSQPQPVYPEGPPPGQ